jgi:hypothetical protein
MRPHKLSVSTKAKRELLVSELEALAKRLGVQIEVDRDRRLSPKEIYVTMRLEHFAVSMSLEGGSNVGAFIGHWHSKSLLKKREERDNEMTYPRDFGFACGGSVNQHHWMKATTVREDFDGFLMMLEAGFERLKRAFAEQPIAVAA